MGKPTFHVELWYSSDNLSQKGEWEKSSELRKGGDLVTKVLNHFGVCYFIQLASDFYHPEPILEKVQQKDKHGKNYTVYSRWGSFGGIEGQYDVLRYLEGLGVIPCTVEEAIREVKGNWKKRP